MLLLRQGRRAGARARACRAALYGELEERLGAEARIRRKGGLIVHPEAATWAAEPARLERVAVAGARLVGADELRELEPGLTGAVCGASLFPGDLQCDPRAIARALAREAAAAGATSARAARSRRSSLATARRARSTAWRAGAACRRAAIARAPSSSRPARGARRSPRAPASPLPLEPRKGQLVRLAAPRPASSATRSSTAPTSARSRATTPAWRSRPWSRRRSTATCSSAPRASGAASTRASTRR